MSLNRDLVDAEWNRLCGDGRGAQALARWAGDEHLAAPTLDALVARITSAPPADADAALVALVRRAVEGDVVAAWATLRCLQPAIAALASRFCWRTNRADVAAELLSYAWERIATYPVSRRPSKVAANVILDVRKRYLSAVVRPTAEVTLEEDAPSTGSASSAEDEALARLEPPIDVRSALRHVVNSAVDANDITPETAEVFWRHRVLGHSVAAIAADTGVTDDAVRRRVHRATTALARHATPQRAASRRRRVTQPLSDDVKRAVIAYALDHPDHGPRTIATRLRWARHGGLVVSHGSVHQMLRAAGLATREARISGSTSAA